MSGDEFQKWVEEWEKIIENGEKLARAKEREATLYNMLTHGDRVFLAEVRERFMGGGVRNEAVGSGDIRNEPGECEAVENEVVGHEEDRDEELEYEELGHGAGEEDGVGSGRTTGVNVEREGRTFAHISEENGVRVESEVWRNGSLPKCEQWRVILLLFYRTLNDLQ